MFVQFSRFGWKETVEQSTTTTEKCDLALDVNEIPALIACLQQAWALAERAGVIAAAQATVATQRDFARITDVAM